MKANYKNCSIFVDSKDSLVNYLKIHKPEDGQTFKVMNGNYYIWHDGQLNLFKPKGEGDLGVSLYDLNKSIIAQLPPLTPQQSTDAEALINDFHAEKQNKFYLLYGKEINYFTLFEIVDKENNNFGATAIECLINVGALKSVELTKDKNSIEIWVEDNNKIPTVLYLFPYDTGIVKVTA